MSTNMAYQQVVRGFSICKDVHFVLIDALYICEVLPYFFNSDVDYYISLDMLFLNIEI